MRPGPRCGPVEAPMQPDRDVGRVDAARDPGDERVAERLDLLARARRRVEDREALDRAAR